MCRAALCASVLALAAGCIPLYQQDGDAFAVAGRDGPGAYRVRRRKATWFLVRVWADPVGADGPAAAAHEVAVESLKGDVARAGLRVAVDVPPDVLPSLQDIACHPNA